MLREKQRHIRIVITLIYLCCSRSIVIIVIVCRHYYTTIIFLGARRRSSRATQAGVRLMEGTSTATVVALVAASGFLRRLREGGIRLPSTA